MTVSFRLIRPDDEAFLYEVYASTRTEELAVVDWDEAHKAAFLHMQFAAQHQFYQEHYTKTDFLIILRYAVPVGRLYIARWQDEIRIMDIALLPPYRNAGIGTAILRDLLAEAAAAHKPVRIHVEKFNPALQLYERLGFTPIEDKGVYLFMEWAP
jgi:GNAT superfamily N-acetyltransferase